MVRCAALTFLLALCLAGCAAKATIHSASVVNVNGMDIGYEMSGQGEPLLMIMGYGGTMDVWDPVLVDRLDDHYTVIRFDNRNVGFSSTSAEPVTVDLMALDALGLLDALGIEQAHVLGWSMGSMIAQEMALARPDAVEKLVLYGTISEHDAVMRAIGQFDGLTPRQFMDMLFPKDWAAQNQGIYTRLPKPAKPATPEAIARQRQALAKWPGTTDRLREIRHDTLLVVGEEDSITPPEQSLAVAGKLPGAWLVRFKGAGHWLMYQTPDGLASAIHLFIQDRQNLLQQ